jgi:PAS domain S-box-containing protein
MVSRSDDTLDDFLDRIAPTGREAEETLQAIVLGDADALVIESKDGPRVYTLTDANEPYRRLVERMSEAAAIVDQDGTILYCNGRLPSMVGRNELAGRSFLDLVIDEHRDRAEGLLASGACDDATAEMALRSVDGRTVAVRCSAAPMAFDDRPSVALVMMVLDDIAALKAALEESHRHKAEAEGANLAKSKFLAAASHDLRHPFQAMRLFFEVLDRQVTDARQRQVLDRLGESMNSAEAFLNDMFDVAKFDSGGVSVKRELVAPSRIVRDLMAELAPVAANKGLEFRVFTHDGGLVDTDPFLLKRVLFNLLANAIRYTETGGVLFGVRKRGESMAFEVWDTGIGIAPEVQELVFDEFYQVADEAQNRSKGTGLGLAIVRRLCGLLQCQVSLTSRPGRGSVFRVVVPSAPPAPPPDGQGSLENVNGPISSSHPAR